MDSLFTLSYKDPTGKHLQNFHYGNEKAKVWKGCVMPHRHTAKNMDFKPSLPPLLSSCQNYNSKATPHLFKTVSVSKITFNMFKRLYF